METPCQKKKKISLSKNRRIDEIKNCKLIQKQVYWYYLTNFRIETSRNALTSPII